MFGMASWPDASRAHDARAKIVLTGFALSTMGMAAIIPLVPRVDSGWYLCHPPVVTGAGLGLLVSQLNNFTLAPISEERVSEAAGANPPADLSGCRSGWPWREASCCGLSALSFTHLTDTSTIIPPAQQQQISTYLEDATPRS